MSSLLPLLRCAAAVLLLLFVQPRHALPPAAALPAPSPLPPRCCATALLLLLLLLQPHRALSQPAVVAVSAPFAAPSLTSNLTDAASDWLAGVAGAQTALLRRLQHADYLLKEFNLTLRSNTERLIMAPLFTVALPNSIASLSPLLPAGAGPAALAEVIVALLTAGSVSPGTLSFTTQASARRHPRAAAEDGGGRSRALLSVETQFYIAGDTSATQAPPGVSVPVVVPGAARGGRGRRRLFAGPSAEAAPAVSPGGRRWRRMRSRRGLAASAGGSDDVRLAALRAQLIGRILRDAPRMLAGLTLAEPGAASPLPAASASLLATARQLLTAWLPPSLRPAAADTQPLTALLSLALGSQLSESASLAQFFDHRVVASGALCRGRWAGRWAGVMCACVGVGGGLRSL